MKIVKSLALTLALILAYWIGMMAGWHIKPEPIYTNSTVFRGTIKKVQCDVYQGTTLLVIEADRPKNESIFDPPVYRIVDLGEKSSPRTDDEFKELKRVAMGAKSDLWPPTSSGF